MSAGFSTPTRSEAQKLDRIMKPSIADRDLFQGVTNDWASLATLSASLNSPRSRMSLNSSLEPEEVTVEEVLLLQALMLNILREMESEPSW